MACSKYASTRQTTHAARMSRLLFGPCTDLLRDVLRQHIPETSFPSTLQNSRVKGILLSLRNLQASQRELLYPQVGTFRCTYEDFDISLLYILLRNITNIIPHSNGWGSPPDVADRSVSANIDRIRMIRNQIGAHCHRHDLCDADFSSSWAELKQSIVEIVRSTGIPTNYEQIINDLANEPMDPDREDYWLLRLQAQIQEDAEKYEEIVKNVDIIQEKIKRISNEQDKLTRIQRDQGEVQTKHRSSLTEHEDRLNKQGEVQDKQGSILTQHEDRLDKQGEVQTKQGSNLTEHEDRLNKQGEVQAKQVSTLTKHEERLNKQGKIQSKQEAILIEHEKRLNKQENANDQEAKNIIDNTKSVLQNHKSSKTYTRTKQVDTVIQKLREHHIVILTGRPGDGKSTLAKQVMCELAEIDECVPVRITEPSEWNKVINSKERMIVNIDDMFGVTNIDTSTIDKWKKKFDVVISSANEGNISVLISSRRNIIAEVRKICHESFLSSEYEVDLTSNEITSKEKRNMLSQYENVHRYRVSELIGDQFRLYEKTNGKNSVYQLDYCQKRDIVRSKPYYGFPQTCFLFFAKKDFYQLGTRFFSGADATLFRNIDEMRKSMDANIKIRYCILAYVFLEGRIHIFDMKKDIFREICEKSAVMKWTDVDVEDAVQDLEGIFLSPSNQKHVHSFCHVTIREAVAASFGKLAPDIVIQKCSDKIIQELVRTENYEERDEEVILTIRKKYYPLLANRLLIENTKYGVYHSSTDDPEFTPVLFDVINTSPHICTIIKKIWDSVKYKDKPLLYRELLARYGPHHIKHEAEYESDMPVYERDSDTSVKNPYLITYRQIKHRLDDLLLGGYQQRVIIIIRYVISKCDVHYFLNSNYRHAFNIPGMSVLYCCVARGWMDVVDELLNVVTPSKTENYWSCLHFAAFFGRLELFQKFEKLSSNVLETTREGYNILQVILLGLRHGMQEPYLVRYYLSISASDYYRVSFKDISQHDTEFINTLRHVLTGYPSLITSIDLPLDDYNNNIIHYLVIHDREEIYDVLVQKRKDLIFHRNDTELRTTLHVAAYLGRLKFVEKLWNAGVRAEETDLSINDCIESGEKYNSQSLTCYDFGMWYDQKKISIIDQIKLKCIRGQSIRFGSSQDYFAIISMCLPGN